MTEPGVEDVKGISSLTSRSWSAGRSDIEDHTGHRQRNGAIERRLGLFD
jgi:hypothetical protein